MVGPSTEWLVLQYFQVHGLYQNSWSFSIWLVLQYFQIHGSYHNVWSFSISRFTSHIRTVGLSVFPDSRVISEWLVLQQNAWSFSISRFTGHTRMVGPSVFSDSRVMAERLVLQYFQIHESYQNAWSFSTRIFSRIGLSDGS